MSLVWIICGGGRGVGKTRLAEDLCRVLPGSVYAKSGHGKVVTDKCKNYFHDLAQLRSFIEKRRYLNKHIVIESNTLAKCEDGDIKIFIDGVVGKTHFRKDSVQLSKLAEVKICRDSSLFEWEEFLRGKVDCKELCRAVCDCLYNQKCYLFGSGPNAHSKVWLEISGEYIFGNGLERLLENVRRLGTLRDAAKSSDMSYRYAWGLIHSAEEHLNRKLIIPHSGGSGGGGSTLSPDGFYLLRIFNQLKNDIADFTNKRFLELYEWEKSSV